MSTTSSFIVTGMTCEHCVSSVTEEVSEIDGVDGVAITLATGEVLVTSTSLLDPELVRAAVEEAGYALA